ncbi:TolC family protein [Desulfospira joergensenii]|uniref:TolC family protein n=1 Tax=Desulfospira joergensenii TaxID=53329 RepID=UPI0003B5B1B9|nr:TolC family protein [Desulfospira joergensenii]
MKKRFLILILFFASAGWARADYAGMKKELDTYQSPDFFPSFEGPGPVKEGVKQRPKTDEIDAVFRLKQALASELEKFRFFIPADPALLKEIRLLAGDQEKCTALIEKQVDPEEILILAISRNPGLRAAKKEVKAKLAAYDQVASMDDILKTYDSFIKGSANRAGPDPAMKNSIRLSWPSPGLTALKGRAVDADAAIALENLAIMEKNIITLTRKIYWDLALVDESARITRDTIKALERLREVATSLYRSGRTSFQDVIKINIRLALLEQDLATYRLQRRNIEARLLENLNLPAESRVGAVGQLPLLPKIPLPETLYPVAGKERQEIKLIRHRITKLQAMVEMAESMTDDSFSLGFSFNDHDWTGTSSGFLKKTLASGKNNQPKRPWNGIAQPWLEQTRQALAGLEQNLIQEKKASERMIREAWFEADKNLRELTLFESKILALSQSALDVSSREYETGSIPFSQAISSYTDWLGIRLAIAEKRTGLGKSVAELEKRIGKPIIRKIR